MTTGIGNKTKIQFACADETVALFIDILGQLQTLTKNRQNRVIRIGGKEYIFYGEKDDGIWNILIDNSDPVLMSPNTISFYANKRKISQTQTTQGVNMTVNTQNAKTAKTLPTFVSPTTGTVTPDDDDDDVTGAVGTPPIRNVVTLTANQKATIENTVADLTSKNELFTAWDVTKVARKTTPNEKLFHNHVKAYVHSLFEQGFMPTQYTRSLANLANVPVQPWLYFPINIDPDTYKG